MGADEDTARRRAQQYMLEHFQLAAGPLGYVSQYLFRRRKAAVEHCGCHGEAAAFPLLLDEPTASLDDNPRRTEGP